MYVYEKYRHFDVSFLRLALPGYLKLFEHITLLGGLKQHRTSFKIFNSEFHIISHNGVSNSHIGPGSLYGLLLYIFFKIKT